MTGRLEARPKAKNKSEDELARFTPSYGSRRRGEAHETGWARFRYYCVRYKRRQNDLKYYLRITKSLFHCDKKCTLFIIDAKLI